MAMTKPREVKAQDQLIIDMQTSHVEQLNWRCCANCENWSRDNDTCWKYKARPPVDVVAVGCIEWFNIPF